MAKCLKRSSSGKCLRRAKRKSKGLSGPSCPFGRVKSGPRKNRCRKRRVVRRRAK
jgi:hypothetical protein